MCAERPGYKVTHHVVYSVKGGCGKTSFSLFLLLSRFMRDGIGELTDDKKSDTLKTSDYLFDDEHQHLKSPGSVKNYYLDMDFLGTSLIYNIGENYGPDYIKMDDLIFNKGEIRLLAKGANRVNVKGIGKNDAMYIIPSSHHETDKEKFHVKRRYTPLLRYDEFFHEIDSIVSEIKLHENSMGVMKEVLSKYDNAKGEEKEPYDLNFIYDLPPNADGYTEALFDYLTTRADSGENVILYLVFNNDTTMHCDIEWLSNFLSSGREKNFRICFVFNTVTAYTITNGNKMALDNKTENEDKEFSKRYFDSVSAMMMKFCPDVKYKTIRSRYSFAIMNFNYRETLKEEDKGKVKLETLFVNGASDDAYGQK